MAWWDFLYNIVIGWVAPFITAAINLVKNWASWIWSGITGLIFTIASTITSWWNDNIKPIWDGIVANVSNFASWVVDGFTDITAWFSSALDDAIGWLVGAWNTFADWVTDVIDVIGEWWDDTWASISTTIRGWIDAAVSFVTTHLTNFIDWLGEIGGNLASWISTAIGNAVDWISAGWSNLVNMVGGVWDSIVSAIGGAIDAALSWMSSAFDNFILWLDVIGTTIAGYIQLQIDNTIEFIMGIIPGVVSAMFEWAKPVIQPIINAVGFLGTIVDMITGRRPEEPEIRENINKRKEIQEEINRLAGEI